MMAVSCTFYRHMHCGMVWMCHFPFLSRASLIFYKDSANERNESLLSNSRVQPILYKDNASEWKENLFSVSRTQLILYKDNAKRVQQQVGKTQFYQT